MERVLLYRESSRWIDNGDFEDKIKRVYEWIRNNNNVLDAGHPYANDLYEEWGEAMNFFFD